MTAALTRRELGRAAAALVVAFTLRPRFAVAQGAAKKLPGSLDKNRALDAWLRIEADGTVTVFTGKVELGQGILTALRQIAAEELDVAVQRIRMVSGDTERTPDEGVTSGSLSIEQGGTALRYAAAEARAILLERAARKLGAEVGALAVEDGTVRAPNGGSVTYGALAGEGPFGREATAGSAPKPAAAHRIVGTPAQRIDIPAKVTGGSAYVQDMRLPGMLFGRVVRPPSPAAELVRLDEEAVRRMPGVVAVVRDGRFIAVAAAREEQAIAAREALRASAVWREQPKLPPPDDVHAYLRSLPAESHTISERLGGAPAQRRLAARYTRPYLAHASIGPSCAVAEAKGGRVTVWTHSQGVFPLRRDLATALRQPPETIAVKHVEGSGCYGHNGADDVALDAALLARAVEGRPVKLQWMRDDEFGWEPCGPAMTMAVEAGLGADGRIVDWNYQVWSNTHSTRPGRQGGANLLAAWHLADPIAPPPPEIIPQPSGGGDRNAIPLYAFPAQKVVHHFIRGMPLRVSALRTLGAHGNVFAVESFMDELALAAGTDPVAFRLMHLEDARARAVIEAAAKKANWRPGAAGDGTRGRGIGFARYKNLATYVAVVVEVEVDRTSGAVRAMKAVAAADAGQIVNPDGLANQIEGGIVQATSWTLKEALAFDTMRILAHDWESYPILGFADVPEVEVELIDRPELPSLGAGEAAAGPTAAALANAVAHATGARVRDLPLSPARVRAALG